MAHNTISFEKKYCVVTQKVMCCDKLATTQYFLKKIMCCDRKNKLADTCHHKGAL